MLLSYLQMEFDMDVMIFLALYNPLFKFVKRDGFQYLISKFKPKANIKSELSFRKYKLAKVHESLKYELKKKLEEEQTSINIVAFTTVGWIAANDNSFISLTVSYITKEFEMHIFTRGCRFFNDQQSSEI